MARMSGGRFIAETFKSYGITHVFFMPVIAPRALLEMESLGIKRIMTHGEKPAAYMADGYARVKRGVGICMAQSVGAANLAAGLQDAFLACTPIIAITGRQVQINQNRHAYQEIDHIKPYDAVTKYNVPVTGLDQLPYALRHAFREATTGTPGPVHLDFDGFVGQQIAEPEADFEVIVEAPFTRLPPFRPEPGKDQIEHAVRLLTEAARPVIIAGGGVVQSDAGPELVAIAEKLQIPVATSLNAKETFPHDHPLAVGVPGQYSRACANQTVAGADLVFFVGSHAGGQVTNEWNLLRPGTPVMQLDINPSELGRNFALTLALQGDVKVSLAKIIDHAEAVTTRADWVGRAQALVKTWHDEVSVHRDSDALPMRPERLCRELSDALPPDAILVSDTGHAGIWTGTMIDLKHPGQSYVRCAGSLGWGLPAAIGAKCAAPQRPVLCFTGDGGIWYHLSELETAVKYGIHTVTIVNNNHSLNQEKAVNERTYGGQTQGSDDLWVFPDADFAKIGEAMGCFGMTVTKPSELPLALEQAFAANKPAVIDVKTDIEGIAPRAWQPS